MNPNEIKRPEKISSYFYAEWKSLVIITISGILYNVGLLAGPLFEGKLAQCLTDIFSGTKAFADMAQLAAVYITVIAAVQITRYIKRLHVRQFANHINRNMKQIIYGNLVHKPKAELENENIGNVMTKAISDVDACAEGMRKFTTEIFDTGVALICYIVLLLTYDWRLALVCLIFPPFSYLIAQKMKTVVQRTGAAYKESAGRLSDATLDRVSGATTYRVFGSEEQQNNSYEKYLDNYEASAIKANIRVSALPPIYQTISMTGVLFILYFGAKNVSGEGCAIWDIAAFTTFLSCYTKLSVKSSKAAKLFNAVQKAQVSWKRIKPYLHELPKEYEVPAVKSEAITVTDLGVNNPEGIVIFDGLSFKAKPGQIIGVTGPVASGKSTLGKVFLCEKSYNGSIKFGDNELSEIDKLKRQGIISYIGHDSELMSDSIRNNILMGKNKDIDCYLKAVCLDKEVKEMPAGADTLIGSGGILLSGGQKQRVALARTLAHRKPIMVLDDPFSALDKNTEREVFAQLKELTSNSIVILISHRLYLFPQLNGVIWLENGTANFSDHEKLMKSNPMYAKLYKTQQEGGTENEV